MRNDKSHPNKVIILLIEPENPNNIGAVARAMKNMGLSELRLVKPPLEWQAKGKKMAMSAWDVLERAKVCKDMREALKDTALVIGTTRRTRRYKSNHILFQEAIRRIGALRKRKKVAIMFGKESKGLDNNALSFCDWVTSIPAHPEYPSINLAQAVMIIAFSLFYEPRKDQSRIKVGMGGEKVEKKEIYEVLNFFEAALNQLGYMNHKNHLIDRISTTFHDLIKRNGLLKREAQMFKGVFRQICEK